MERLMLDVDLAMGVEGSDVDDGFALALVVADPGVSLELVTTVNGNTDVATATALTLDLLRRLGREDVPVHRGAAAPLLRPASRVGSVPADLEVRRPAGELAAVELVRRVLADPGELTLVAVGPLTNVALALRLHPDFGPGLKELVVMGGVYTQGTLRADQPGEFNTWSDPEAAAVVLSSGVRARWVGLDVTTRVQMTLAEAAGLEAGGHGFAAFAGRHTAAWIRHLDADRAQPRQACALHDPLAVLAVLRPDLLTFRDAYLQVETGDRARGVMVTDFLEGRDGRAANARVAVDVDVEGCRELLLSRLGSL